MESGQVAYLTKQISSGWGFTLQTNIRLMSTCLVVTNALAFYARPSIMFTQNDQLTVKKGYHLFGKKAVAHYVKASIMSTHSFTIG